jgi:hypothetical protein
MIKKLFVPLAAIVIGSCSKSTSVNYMARGTITGADYRVCKCCNGYILKMDGNDSAYRFDHFPANSTIDSMRFPITVKFNYKEMGTCGDIHLLDVRQMELVK